ncbi:hypothetical protein YL93_21675 [Salmonella enterica subsp. enterica serovar Montevideo]|nr:hypothetical protein [Salmonella enterica subsp. enterica serovar Montevideo]
MREFTVEHRDKLIETARYMITWKLMSPESEYLRDLAQIALNVLTAEETGTELSVNGTALILGGITTETSW